MTSERQLDDLELCFWRIDRCLEAAARAHDPDIRDLWMQHAASIRANYDRGKN
jgi:hypothetical protein|tara:strand:- start:6911 stop:7069 length:159 start_codon:yes stop_codon:yes gene_type:complete